MIYILLNRKQWTSLSSAKPAMRCILLSQRSKLQVHYVACTQPGHPGKRQQIQFNAPRDRTNSTYPPTRKQNSLTNLPNTINLVQICTRIHRVRIPVLRWRQTDFCISLLIWIPSFIRTHSNDFLKAIILYCIVLSWNSRAETQHTQGARISYKCWRLKLNAEGVSWRLKCAQFNAEFGGLPGEAIALKGNCLPSRLSASWACTLQPPPGTGDGKVVIKSFRKILGKKIKLFTFS